VLLPPRPLPDYTGMKSNVPDISAETSSDQRDVVVAKETSGPLAAQSDGQLSMPMVPNISPPPHILALLLAWFTVAAPRLIPTSLVLIGLVRRWKQHRRSLVAISLTWVACYLHSVRRIRLRIGGAGTPSSALGRRLAHIVRLCPSLTSLYWPTWYAPFSTMQVALLLCKEARGRFLQRSCYTREVLPLDDGVCIALDWVEPPASDSECKRVASQKATQEQQCPFVLPKALLPYESAEGPALAPVCVLLHGAFMDSSSITMSDLARSLAARGFPVVVMGRRGYGGLSIESTSDSKHLPKVSFYGFDEDLRCVLDAVAKRHPRRPVALVGFSCGSGFATRFTGNQSIQSAWETSADARDASSAPSTPKSRLLCMIAYDGAYDASPEGGPVALLRWPYTWIVNCSVKFFYVLRHYDALRRAGFADVAHRLLNPFLNLQETYRETLHLSGAKTVDEFLKMQQPRLSGINIPSLLVNSRDDPICVWENVEHAFSDILANPNIAHAEMFCGTHGCKFGFLGFSSLMEQVVGEFVAASWHEWQATHNSHQNIALSDEGCGA